MNEEEYIEYLKKDLVKGWGIPYKALFGNKEAFESYLAKELKKIELENIQEGIQILEKMLDDKGLQEINKKEENNHEKN